MRNPGCEWVLGSLLLFLKYPICSQASIKLGTTRLALHQGSWSHGSYLQDYLLSSLCHSDRFLKCTSQTLTHIFLGLGGFISPFNVSFWVSKGLTVAVVWQVCPHLAGQAFPLFRYLQQRNEGQVDTGRQTQGCYRWKRHHQ